MRKQEFNSKHLPSPARRGSRSRTASPPAPLAIRKAPSGRRRKSRRQSHKFFKHLLRLAPQLAATPWGGSPPRPLRQKICYQTAQKTALCAPWEHPGGFGIRGSRSRPPLRRPRPLRFERLRVPVWNPYSGGRLGPAKSEDRKGGEGKVDANLTIFLSTDAAGWHPN